jgi:protein TonB
LLGQPAAPLPPPPLPKLREETIPSDAVKVSNGILQGALATKKVQPEYPPIAKAARVQGPVSIQVLLSETGQLLDAVVLEGPPLLREAALAAARQWQFKPHQVNGKAVKAAGILVFNFALE